jgi:Glycosyltransferase family 87
VSTLSAGKAAATIAGTDHATGVQPAGLGPGPEAGPAWSQGRRARLAVAIVLTLEAGLVVGFAAVYRPHDLEIYLWGGRAVAHGLRLYLVTSHGAWFTYPPFAAALFAPIAALPALVVRLGWELGSVGAFAWCCGVTLKLAGYRPSRIIRLAVVAAGLLLEPVYHTLYLGQVNLFLLALVLGDVWHVARGRHSGVGVGLAAAIKLVPGIFILLFLLTRRTRDAVTAAATFTACGLIGFAVDPSASRLYWTRLFYDTTRVSATYISNQSAYAAVARIAGGVGDVGGWYYAVPLVLGVTGLAAATTLGRRGDWLAAAAMTGTTGLLVSPISWTHHWVWIMPALVALWRGGIGSRVAAGCGYLLFALAPMWWTPHSGQAGDYGSHGVITLIANSFLIAGVAFLIYVALRTYSRRRSEPRFPPGDASPAGGRECGQTAGGPPVALRDVTG